MNRIVNVIEEILKSEFEHTIVVTHGNLLSLLVIKFNKDFGFEDWKNLIYKCVVQLHRL
ncbi:hypothetical protein [Metabacillus arenae]|uniref:hypothetical protein n=1 Tax=Metabacillus arenae TaxID=2771434 RepID=UPI001CD15ACF|nr:hypothetical protein [Metabacillus arenae]